MLLNVISETDLPGSIVIDQLHGYALLLECVDVVVDGSLRYLTSRSKLILRVDLNAWQKNN